MKKAFLFDFDGIIVDSERHWRDIGDAKFYPSIIPGWTRADNAKMMGRSLQTGYEMLVKEYGLKMGIDEYMAKIHELTSDIYYMEKLQLLPGLSGLIDRVQSLNMIIGIGSSGSTPWIQNTLGRFSIAHHFPSITSSDDVAPGRAKPFPDIYLLAAERAGVQPEECIVLEDSTNGILAAKAAGMVCIALRSDMSVEQNLSKADMIVGHYDELTADVLGAL